jgi:nucleotide-binding universal stress UspA family protein
VVHAWSYPPAVGPGHAFPPVYEAGHVASEASRLMSEILAGWRQKFPDVQVTEDIVRSGAAKHLVEVSSTQQLMVVGRHGHPGNPVRRLGSVSQAVVHHTHCPIAVLPEN